MKDVEMNILFNVLHLVLLLKSMLNSEKMKTLLMIDGLSVSARCSCPILVLLRWDAEMLSRGSSPSADVHAVVVVVDAANHTSLVDATFSLVDDHDDAMIYLVDVVVLFLYDVVIPVLL